MPGLISDGSIAILVSMAANGDKSKDERLAGIRLILEEIRDLKEEMRDIKKEISTNSKATFDLLKQAGEDRRQWAEDRKQAAEDRKEAAEDRKQAAEDRKRIAEEASEDRRGIRQALVVIGNAGRRIIATQNRHTELLENMLQALKALGKNGKQGNGH